MVGSFVIFLREALEASLIVSILMAALRQLGQTRLMRAVWIGVALAIVVSLGGAAVIYATVREYDDTAFEHIFEGITFLAAVGVLTWVTIWMQRHSRTLKQELTEKARAANSGFGLGLLAFVTVGREGLETAVFMLALAFAFQSTGPLVLLGAVLGLLVAVGICIAIYALGYRLDYRIFFRVMGIILIFFAAGLLGNAVHEFQELGWLPFANTPLWSTAHILDDETSQLGSLLHGLLGYSDAPTLLQVLLYVAYLVGAGSLFWRLTRKSGPKVSAPVVAAQ
jgi:high-affinity iron transporter